MSSSQPPSWTEVIVNIVLFIAATTFFVFIIEKLDLLELVTPY